MFWILYAHLLSVACPPEPAYDIPHARPGQAPGLSQDELFSTTTREKDNLSCARKPRKRRSCRGGLQNPRQGAQVRMAFLSFPLLVDYSFRRHAWLGNKCIALRELNALVGGTFHIAMGSF